MYAGMSYTILVSHIQNAASKKKKKKKTLLHPKEAKKVTQELNLPNWDKRAHEPTTKFAKKSKTKGATSGPRFSRKGVGR